jgi:hypothetical protein
MIDGVSVIALFLGALLLYLAQRFFGILKPA